MTEQDWQRVREHSIRAQREEAEAVLAAEGIQVRQRDGAERNREPHHAWNAQGWGRSGIAFTDPVTR